MMKRLYVAYGSNMDTAQMAARCPDAKLIGTGILHDWRLMFKGEPPNSYATIEQEKDFSVPVVLWELTGADERWLDRYEGFPKSYYKLDVEVELDNGTTATGMVYVMPDERRLNLPCDHYYAVLYAAYEKFEFDIKILEDALMFSDTRSRMFNFPVNG